MNSNLIQITKYPLEQWSNFRDFQTYKKVVKSLPNNRYYESQVCDQLVELFEKLRLSQERIKITYGGKRAKYMTKTKGVLCNVSRLPALIHHSKARNGIYIDTENIIKIESTKNGNILYENKNYCEGLN